jgi:spore coat polysaccharide biosynthesis protein SpsF
MKRTRSAKVVGIIEARFASTRLPGKVLLPIHGATMLARVVERLRNARTIDEIIVATSVNSADDAVEAEAVSIGVPVFRGSEEDVLDRVVGAAAAREADIIVEITGDCPLLDPGIVDKVVGDFLMGGADFVGNIHPHTTPRGTDVRVFRSGDLAEINAKSTDPADHEHVSLHFWEHPERYVCRNVETNVAEEVASLRLTVDTAEDLEFVAWIYCELYSRNPDFTLADVLALIAANPAMVELNQHIEQKLVRA